jgi:hypothetical protein
MQFTVSDEIWEQATRCQKDLSCLKGNRNDLCKVQHRVDGKVHFIKWGNSGSCPYQLSFGDAFVCLCPVRKELYNRYRV